jgi:hypothetical protein
LSAESRSLPAVDAKNGFADAQRWVESDELILVTRYGKELVF